MTVIITGASRGLGRAMAEKFAEAGYSLLLNSVNKAGLKKAAEEISQLTGNGLIEYYATNLSDKQSSEQFADWCLSFGEPNILINNAGRFLPGSILSHDIDLVEQMWQDNFLSAYYLTSNIVPSMIRRKKGHIFNICSIASLQAYDNGGAYSISKYALSGFSKNLRRELIAHQVKVTTIYPGAAYTDSWKGSGVAPERIMSAKDVADMVFAAAHLSPMACVEEIVMRPTAGDL
jgi:short-subunit dehydrogenase